MKVSRRSARTGTRARVRRVLGLTAASSAAAVTALAGIAAPAPAELSPAELSPAASPATARSGAIGALQHQVFHPVAGDEAFAQLRGRGYERALGAARRHAAEMRVAGVGARSTPPAWTPLGPDPISGTSTGGANSGRVTGLAAVPGATPQLVAATAGGGVWTAAEAAAPDWSTTTDTQPDIAMGAVTVDPNDASTIYAGTGEDNACGDCFYGDGILKSTDGGSTWTLENPGGVFTGVDMSSLAVQPGDASQVWAGTTSGLFESTDGGTIWAQDPGLATALGSPSQYNVDSLAVDPSSPSTIWVGVDGFGLYKSTDDGSTWSPLAISLPSGSAYGTTKVALAPSATSTAYVFVGACGNVCGSSQRTAVGLFKTTDGGSSWSQLTSVPPFWSSDYAYNGSGSGGSDQSWYDTVLAVDPTDPGTVVVGGITAVESTDGGATWSNLNGGGFFTVSTSLFHPDLHALAFDASGNLFIGCDGGVFELDAAGVASPGTVSSSELTSLNTNLDTVQFYPGSQQAGDLATVLAGAQDNGTDEYSSSNSPATTWPQLIDGDGAFNIIDPANAKVQYAEADQKLFGTNDGWATALTVNGSYVLFGPCSVYNGTPCAAKANFVPPIAMVPGSSGPTLWYGGDVVYQSTDGGTTWTALSTYSSSKVSAIAFAPGDPQVAYVGFDDGTMQMTRDGGTTWTTLTSAPTGGSFVTHIAVDSTTPYTIYFTLAQGTTQYRDGAVPPDVVVGTSLDMTPSWSDVTGNLPTGVPTNAVIQAGTGLVVADDTGVYSTTALNGASTAWARIGTGMPNVQVMDVLLTSGGHLLATTHGRGVWSVPFSTGAPSLPSVAALSPTSGPEAGGTAVTITGTNFTAPATVAFASNAAIAVSVVSATKITATSPPGSGTVDVTVTTSAGTSATSTADKFAYSARGRYHALTPSRICDTRSFQPVNQCTGETLGAGATDVVAVVGHGGIPASGATAVVVNVTAVDPTGTSYLTIYPDGQLKPLTSSLNFHAGQDVPNLVTVAPGQDGKVDVFNGSGTVDLVVDVEGYFASGGSAGAGLYDALTPARICDTRTSQRANQCTGKTLAAGGTIEIAVAGEGGVPATGVAAVVLNVTAIGSASPGYLTVFPHGATQPTASNVNYQAGEIVPNRVMVPLGKGGAISIFFGNGAPEIAVDVSGWFTDSSNPAAIGAQFTSAASPVRICDTRASQLANQCTGKTLAGGVMLSITATGGTAGVPADASAVVLNVTAADETRGGYLTVFPAGQSEPVASDLNFARGDAVANMTVATLGAGPPAGGFSVDISSGWTDLVVDLVGWYS